MMKKKSLCFASFNIVSPSAKTTVVDRTTGALKKLEKLRFQSKLPQTSSNSSFMSLPLDLIIRIENFLFKGVLKYIFSVKFSKTLRKHRRWRPSLLKPQS